jgi:hypothetical protein
MAKLVQMSDTSEDSGLDLPSSVWATTHLYCSHMPLSMATHAPVPYELDMFTQLGIVKDIGPMFDSGLA